MKNLDQSVFKDAPDWATWAFVNAEGAAWIISKKPKYGKSWSHKKPCFYTNGGDAKAVCIGSGYNTERWRDSSIRRAGVAK